jgi:hypothetical protein
MDKLGNVWMFELQQFGIELILLIVHLQQIVRINLHMFEIGINFEEMIFDGQMIGIQTIGENDDNDHVILVGMYQLE